MARRGYVQLVNGFYDNDKVRDLVRMGRADSVGVYCMALSLCGDRLTDGFIPRRAMLSNIGATPEQVRASWTRGARRGGRGLDNPRLHRPQPHQGTGAARARRRQGTQKQIPMSRHCHKHVTA